jgi:hypothetical protein
MHWNRDSRHHVDNILRFYRYSACGFSEKKLGPSRTGTFSPIISSLLPQEPPSIVTAYFEAEKEGWENVSNSVLTIKPELLRVGEARHPPTRASVSPSFFCLNLSLRATSPLVWRRF